MKLFTHKKMHWIYGLLLVWGLMVFLTIKFLPLAPWIITSAFFFLLFCPGFCWARIFKMEFLADRLSHVILSLTFGFIFVFLLCFIAILTGLNINQLMVIYLIALPCLFIVSVILDLGLRGQNEDFSFDMRSIFKLDHLIYLLPLILVVLVLAAVSSLGGNFDGDPRYHLAIMRKAIEGQALTPANLNYIKGQFSIAYIFPIWHVFLTLFAKITHANIFVIWAQIPFSLSILVLIVWYWLLNKILVNRYLVILSFLIFMAFYFKNDAYLFTRLAVPDSLGQLLFFPLSVGLAHQYIFDQKTNYKLLLTVSIFVILMAAVHFPHYFYFMFLMLVFGLIYPIFRYHDADFKIVMKRLSLILLVNFLILLPFVILLEAKNKTFSTTFSAYFNKENIDSKQSIGQFDLFTQVSLIFLPLTLLLVKKYRSFILFITALIAIILTYAQITQFLQYWLTKILTHIFVDRLFNNFNWSFMVWAVAIFGLFLFIDRLMIKSIKFLPKIKYLINLSLSFLIIVIIYLEWHNQLFTLVYQKLFLTEPNAWLAYNNIYLILMAAILAITIFIRRKLKKSENFNLEEPSHLPTFLLLAILMSLVIAMPVFMRGGHYLLRDIGQKSFIHQVNDPSDLAAPVAELGGKETIAFIKDNLPPKSIFYSDKGYYSIAMLTDEYLPGYSQTAPRAYELVFKNRKASNYQNRVSCFKQGKIDYFILTSTNLIITKPYLQYPKYFEPVYQGAVTIYKINYDQAEKDFKLKDAAVLTCGV